MNLVLSNIKIKITQKNMSDNFLLGKCTNIDPILITLESAKSEHKDVFSPPDIILALLQ